MRQMGKGTFIVFEGPDGSGKSTQARRLKSALEKKGKSVVLTREPGGTGVGEKIRDILLDPSHDSMRRRTELLLYMASRSQLVDEVIEPSLKDKDYVICDRYVYSSIVYQGFAAGLSIDDITSIGRFATDAVMPDIVLLIDIDAPTGLGRINRTRDRMENRGLAFHEKVRNGFLEMAGQYPGVFRIIDGSGEEDEVFSKVKGCLSDEF